MTELLNEITEEFKKLPQVQAFVLGGSRQNIFYDENSDYDIYVYSTEPIPLDFRKKLAKKYSKKYEIGNNFWEDGDEWTIVNHPNIDIMYRSCSFAEGNLEWVFEKYNASVGFSTCILYNISNSKILFDKDKWFKKLQENLLKPYPAMLIKAIIGKNYPILSNNISSYSNQIKKAIKRNDIINLNNRINAFLMSYFDIIFAINKKLHPGEKRLLQFANETCEILPKDFEKNIINLLSQRDKITENINLICLELEKLLKG